MIRRETVEVTTDASGDATVYSAPVCGELLAIHYVKDDFADGVDFTLTEDETTVSLWRKDNVNASVTVYPRVILQDGAAADITDPKYGKIPLASRVKIVIASGGDTKSGTFLIDYEA